MLGGARYLGHWLKPATRFVARHANTLARMPFWVFSSGPLGTAEVDEAGQDVRAAARPPECSDLAALHPRGERVFFGAFDPASRPASVGELLVRSLPAGRAVLTPGDFRDWGEIDAWADEITSGLAALEPRGIEGLTRQVETKRRAAGFSDRRGESRLQIIVQSLSNV